jgi:DegV family protein with EDD domain
MKKIAIIVDAGCNLPSEFIDKYDIIVVPFHIATQHGYLIDDQNPQLIDDLYERHLRNKSNDYAKSIPLFTDELEAFFLEKVVLKYDQAIFLTLAASRSELYKNISDAWFGISTKCFKLRRDNGIKAGFELEIIDSASLGAGQGLLAYTAALLRENNYALFELKSKLMHLRRSIFMYGVPDDLLYMYTRAKEKNENSITWGKYTLATMFSLKPIIKFNFGESVAVSRAKGLEKGIEKILDHLTNKLNDGLFVKAVVVSFSGDLNKIKSMLAFNRFCDYAKQKQVDVMLCKISLTVAINLGENAFLAAFAAESSHFDE